MNEGNAPTTGPEKGWLVIHGGGVVPNEVKERFIALAGGPEKNFVVIPTALPDQEISQQYGKSIPDLFGARHVIVLHTRDRVRADSDGFVEPLRHASGVWIEGGRQWRLADAYLGTATEREIKAVLARGGVVGGGSAGATIQGSFLVRGAPGDPRNPDGDNTIMMSPGHEKGFGLLANSAIDQHIDARGRENDLQPVIAAHPELLGIGIDQAAAIIVHGNSFFVVGGQVAIHDGKLHNGSPYYFLSTGQSFDLTSRSVVNDAQIANYPLTLTVTSASRSPGMSNVKTIGTGTLDASNFPHQKSTQIKFECDTALYSVGSNLYPARMDGKNRLRILNRPLDSNRLAEFSCRF
jgi:cyanophycinase